MDAWALQYAGTASFVCVCCAGPQLAQEFAKKLQLRACTNTWVDEDDMPAWGQLGCNGFIVLDGSRAVVCRQSPAYLEVKDVAFKYVDTLLQTLIDQKPPPTIAPGAMVQITGLVSKPELNGQVGVCVGGVGANGRCQVSLSDGRSLSVKASNITPAAADTDGCGDCVDGDPGGFDKVTGGCAPRSASKEEGGGGEAAARAGAKRSLEEIASRPLKVSSVKNADLDAEHDRCATALDRLVRDRSEEAARALLAEYEAHFAHEEALLDAHLYAAAAAAEGVKNANGSGGFSADAGARRSHYNDHELLLRGVRAIIGQGTIAPDAIAEIVREFERHADAYDGSYVARLSAALAAAS